MYGIPLIVHYAKNQSEYEGCKIYHHGNIQLAVFYSGNDIPRILSRSTYHDNLRNRSIGGRSKNSKGNLAIS